MKAGIVFFSIMCMLIMFNTSWAGERKIIYLIDGVGAEDKLMLGEDNPVKENKGQSKWHEYSKFNLFYKLNNEDKVIAIYCKASNCVTNKNVQVGMQIKYVIRRYGAPQVETKSDETSSGKEIFRYSGIGFRIMKDRVSGIFIYMRQNK